MACSDRARYCRVLWWPLSAQRQFYATLSKMHLETVVLVLSVFSPASKAGNPLTACTVNSPLTVIFDLPDHRILQSTLRKSIYSGSYIIFGQCMPYLLNSDLLVFSKSHRSREPCIHPFSFCPADGRLSQYHYKITTNQ